MARAPDSIREEAKKLYENGSKLIEIANQLNVPEGTVRSWKNRDKWKCNAMQKEKHNVAKKKKKEKPIAPEVKQVLENEELTDKQRLFCLYYIKCFNATQSYMKAYGCNWETANSCGPRLLVNVSVKKELQRLQEIKYQQITVTETDMVELMMRIAFADIGFYFDFGPKEVPLVYDGNVITDTDGNIIMTSENELTLRKSKEVDTQLISEIKKGKDGVSIKLADKFKAAEWLERYFTMNPMDKHKILYDTKKYELEQKRVEHQIDMDERNNF